MQRWWNIGRNMHSSSAADQLEARRLMALFPEAKLRHGRDTFITLWLRKHDGEYHAGR